MPPGIGYVSGPRSTADSLAEGRLKPNIGGGKKSKKRKILENKLKITISKK